jgi:hypothetical protein
MSEPIIDLDQRYNATIYSYDRGSGHKAVILHGISTQVKGKYSITLDSMATRNQTVVIAQGVEWEIVIELRPRKLTEIERIKLK